MITIRGRQLGASATRHAIRSRGCSTPSPVRSAITTCRCARRSSWFEREDSGVFGDSLSGMASVLSRLRTGADGAATATFALCYYKRIDESSALGSRTVVEFPWENIDHSPGGAGQVVSEPRVETVPARSSPSRRQGPGYR